MLNFKWRILYTLIIAIVAMSCGKDEPKEYSNLQIENSFINHSSIPPSNSLIEDRPLIINSIQDYYSVLESWDIKVSPFLFNPDSSSIIIVQRNIDYDIEKEEIKCITSSTEIVLTISYTLSKSIIKEQNYHELIICSIPKINSNTRIVLRTEVIG